MPAFVQHGKLGKALLARLHGGIINKDGVRRYPLFADAQVFFIKNTHHIIVENSCSSDLGCIFRIVNIHVVHIGTQVAFDKVQGLDLSRLFQQFGLIIPNLGFCEIHDIGILDNRGLIPMSLATVEINQSCYLVSFRYFG